MTSTLSLKPQDIVVLAKLLTMDRMRKFRLADLAQDLLISQSEVSQGLKRLEFHSLLLPSTRIPNRMNSFVFFEHGIQWLFRVVPGALVRGVPTAYSATPLNSKVRSSGSEPAYVWPFDEGTVRGQAIEPLYSTVPQIVDRDPNLYEMLILIDALRIESSRTRDRHISLTLLRKVIGDELYD